MLRDQVASAEVSSVLKLWLHPPPPPPNRNALEGGKPPPRRPANAQPQLQLHL